MSRLVPVILAALALLATPTAGAGSFAWPLAAAKQTSLRSYQLTRIQFTGLKRVPRARAVALTGLRPNSLVTQRDLDAASARLLDSGMFLSIRNQYRMEGYGLVVTFFVEEVEWATPVLFDNFVGYTDEELTRAVAARVPLFEGRAPESQTILGRISAALQDLVRKKTPGASVSYVLGSTWRGDLRHYRFSMTVPDNRLSICSVRVEGLGEGLLAEARGKTASLLGTGYSRNFVEQHAWRNLLPLCHRDGRYRADLAGVVVRPAVAGESCKDGVEVIIRVAPGARYTWSGFVWRGAQLMTPAQLTRILEVEAGAAADEDRLNEGVQAVLAEYRFQGYFAAEVSRACTEDEAHKTVVCQMDVTEGPRFRFRNLELTGLDAVVISRIKALWRLAPGEFYEGSYTSRFIAAVRQLEGAALEHTTIMTRERPDASSKTVDVVIEFGRVK